MNMWSLFFQTHFVVLILWMLIITTISLIMSHIRFSPHPPNHTICGPSSCPSLALSTWIGQKIMESIFGLRSLLQIWQRWPNLRNSIKCRYRDMRFMYPKNIMFSNPLEFLLRSKPVMFKCNWMKRSWKTASCCSKFSNLRSRYLWCHKNVPKKTRFSFIVLWNWYSLLLLLT